MNGLFLWRVSALENIEINLMPYQIVRSGYICVCPDSLVIVMDHPWIHLIYVVHIFVFVSLCIYNYFYLYLRYILFTIRNIKLHNVKLCKFQTFILFHYLSLHSARNMTNSTQYHNRISS